MNCLTGTKSFTLNIAKPPPVPPPVPTITLIGGETLYYPFYNTSFLNYASGTGVNDLSNNTGYVSFSTTHYVIGNNSVFFNNNAGFLQIKTAITPVSLGTTFSVAFWVYFTTTFSDYNNTIFAMSTGGSTDYPSWFVLCGHGTKFGVYSGSNFASIDAPVISINVWKHIVFTCSGGTVNWYINGSLGQTYTGYSPPNASKPFTYIGSQPNFTGQTPMYLSDLRFFNGTALTQSNVTTLYNLKNTTPV